MFKEFRLLYCRFILVAGEKGLLLPHYKGSIFLEDKFKSTLRRYSCLLSREKCGDCLLKMQCSYAYLYEKIKATPWQTRGFGLFAPPFVWQPPLEKKTVYLPGEKLSYNLILFGKKGAYLQDFIKTFQELGEEGLKAGGGRFILKKVWAENPFRKKGVDLLGFSGNKVDEQETVITGEDIELWSRGFTAVSRVSILFLTPTAFRERERYVKEPFFYTLVRELFRRASALYYFFHDYQEMELYYQKFVDDALRVRKYKDQTRFVPLEKGFKKSFPFPGILGEAEYAGNLTQFLPLLKLGEFIHLGENTVFGFGRYRLKIV